MIEPTEGESKAELDRFCNALISISCTTDAAFPAPWLRTAKFWPNTGRVDTVYGDRNLICTLMLPSQMAEEQAAATA
ncbi:hypothetical protein MLD38_015144 [Melastoma candidum]|uniref:Uncharacterized protein n=1 Tax=Melastoma candidum TaxID=119954 RepID=A0ACB9RJC5_9MYRT|nr:hypothetical protein MLD38_015144 [Melastoma candidum]